MCRNDGEDAERAFCDSNFLSMSSLRMSAEARVGGRGRCGCGMWGYQCVYIFLGPAKAIAHFCFFS